MSVVCNHREYLRQNNNTLVVHIEIKLQKIYRQKVKEIDYVK